MEITPPPRPKYTYSVGGGGMWSVAVYGIVHYLKQRSWARQAVGGLGVLCLSYFIVTFVASYSGLGLVSMRVNTIALFVGVFFIFLAVVGGPDFDFTLPEQGASRERVEAEQTFQETARPEDAIDVDLKRLNEYYAINQSQARASFRWAVFAMLVGFGTIITGIWLFYFRVGSRDALMAGLSTAAGIVANLLSAVFLHLHHKTQEHSLHYYDRLAQVQRLALAIRLAEAHSDEAARTIARDRVIDFMLRTKETNQAVGGSAA